MKIRFDGQEIEKVEFAKFFGVVLSGNMKWNEYIVQNENSLLKYCSKRLTALKLLAKEMPQSQRKILAHGLIISKVTYCISCYAHCPNYLKKRIQDIMSEAARIVHGDRRVKLKYQYQELDWLTLEGWINYMDVLTGKTIGAFQKPLDLSAKIGQNRELRTGIKYWTEENQRALNSLPTDTRCVNLDLASYEEKLQFKNDTKGYYMLHQGFF